MMQMFELSEKVCKTAIITMVLEVRAHLLEKNQFIIGVLRQEVIKKNQMKILKLENTITEIKNNWNGRRAHYKNRDNRGKS